MNKLLVQDKLSFTHWMMWYLNDKILHIFLDTASEEEKGLCLIWYLEATLNARVKGGICGCCGREVGVGAWMQVLFNNIPNEHHLWPTEVHEAMELSSGLLLVSNMMEEGGMVKNLWGCVMSALVHWRKTKTHFILWLMDCGWEAYHKRLRILPSLSRCSLPWFILNALSSRCTLLMDEDKILILCNMEWWAM